MRENFSFVTLLVVVILFVSSFLTYHIITKWVGFEVFRSKDTTKIINTDFGIEFTLNDICYIDNKLNVIFNHIIFSTNRKFFELHCKKYNETLYLYVDSNNVYDLENSNIYLYNYLGNSSFYGGLIQLNNGHSDYRVAMTNSEKTKYLELIVGIKNKKIQKDIEESLRLLE